MSDRLKLKDAAAYLAERGCPFKASSLEVMRAQKRGPKFYKAGRFVFYEKPDLDAYVDLLARPVETKDSLKITNDKAE